MENMPLNDGWTLSFTHPITNKEHSLPATVPGNVELDLQRAGLIGDPLPPDATLQIFARKSSESERF